MGIGTEHENPYNILYTNEWENNSNNHFLFGCILVSNYFLNKFRGSFTMCSASGGEEDGKSFCRVTASVLLVHGSYYPVCATNTMSHGSPGTRPLLYRISGSMLGKARGLIRLLSLILFSSLLPPPTHLVRMEFQNIL